MIDFRGNINNWILHSDPDYYSLFIRAWIPFNAWYIAEMPQHNKKDRLIIKELIDNPKSKPRMKIEALLRNTDFESKNFKYQLAQLHNDLERISFIHNNQRLTFTHIELSQNPIKHKSDTDKFGNKFKAEIKPGYFEALVVDKNGKTSLHYKNPIYDLTDLKQNIHFIGLADKRIQNKIYDCFFEINPNKPTNLISKSKNKKDYILLDDFSKTKFTNNIEIISQACIKIIYSLRCMLFHGEIDPTITNAVVYEHGYNILKTIIKELY
jgi:hypothetical protein